MFYRRLVGSVLLVEGYIGHWLDQPQTSLAIGACRLRRVTVIFSLIPSKPPFFDRSAYGQSCLCRLCEPVGRAAVFRCWGQGVLPTMFSWLAHKHKAVQLRRDSYVLAGDL